MYNGKYKSIKSIMNRILINPNMASLNESDAAQYVSDVLRLIEVPMIYQDKVCDIEI